jgi:ElaB/YqjD/DUF883 family membrane-anchored ribosome-binding protein
MIEQSHPAEGLAGSAAALQDRALEAAAMVKESLGKGSESVKAYIVKEPARALGIALGVGVLLGWLIKRR